MATDYDAPRKTDEELAEDSLEELKARRAERPPQPWMSMRPSLPKTSSFRGRISPARTSP